MMREIYYIEKEALNTFACRLKEDFKVFLPSLKEENFTKETDYSYQPFDPASGIAFNPYRSVEPLKSFFTHSQESVAEYFGEEKEIADTDKVVLFGVKACDIAGHKIQDFVFLEGVEVDS